MTDTLTIEVTSHPTVLSARARINGSYLGTYKSFPTGSTDETIETDMIALIQAEEPGATWDTVKVTRL